MSYGTKTIQSVDRAFGLLEEMAVLGRPVRLKEISERCDLHMATCFHILNTFVKRGIVVVNPRTREYKLGIKMLKFTKAILDDLSLGNGLRDHLEKLAEETGETANLIMFEDDKAVHIDQVRSKRHGHHWVFEALGSQIPLHCTGVGKVYLASLPETQAQELLARVGMPKLTPYTITAIDDMMRELDIIRRNGYAVNHEEREEGVGCLAAPLKALSGRVIGAMSISSPIHRINQDTSGSLAKTLTDITNELNSQLGVYFDTICPRRAPKEDYKQGD